MDPYDEIAGLLPGTGHGRRTPAPYTAIRVEGPDAADFVHRLCTQDVLGMKPGRCAPAIFLTAKGRIAALALIGRRDDQRLLIETQQDTADLLFELIDRYHFSEQLSLHREPSWFCSEVIGIDQPEAAGREPWRIDQATSGDLILTGRRHGIGFVRSHGPAAESFAADQPLLGEPLADCLRIISGQILVGIDSEDSTLALEPDVDDHVHLDKGCYTGQEIVARIHTYGHVNRRLLPLKIDTAEPIDRETPLVDEDGDQVGRVMSSRAVPAAEWSVAIGILPNAFLEAGGELYLGAPDGPEATLIKLRKN